MKDVMQGIVYVALFAVPFIPLIIANSMFFPFITGKNFTFRILVEVAFVAWTLLALMDVKYRPRFSWIAASFLGLLGVMLVANATGEYPLKSFWSNFERMDGYVTLVHVFMYLIVLGSMLRGEKIWNAFFNTSLFAAGIVCLYAFAQLSGNITINQGGWRVDATLGNAAYMAVYMLFHSFIALWMLLKSKSTYAKLGYGALMLVFMFLLVRTATRGTTLGLVGGLFLTAAYIALFSGKHAAQVRKFAVGGLAVVVALVGLFIALKDTPIIQDNPILSRTASITLEDGATRFQIWTMAFEGVKERPLLGWGQGNYNYVFNKYFDPDLYGQEPWFDRVHNIVMDWLIAGGALGLIAYLSIFVACLYYIVWRPRFQGDETFTVTEQGLLFGLLGGYFIHNLVVFDNIVSYIFFGTFLALMHSRVAVALPAIERVRVPEKIMTSIALPTAVVLGGLIIYFVNAPGINAAKDIIDGFTAQTPQQMLTAFERALARNSFADQEIREQLTQRALTALTTQGISESDKQAIQARTERELLKQIEEKPGDARIHVFVSSFYRGVGEYDKAREQLVIARQLSPQKQQIMFEQAFTELQAGNLEVARDYFKEAFEIQEEYNRARAFYAASEALLGNVATATALIVTDKQLSDFAYEEFAVNALAQAGPSELLLRVAEKRVEMRPNDLQRRVGLASVQYDLGDSETAIATLEETIEMFPDFRPQGESFIADIRAGRDPGSGSAPQVEVMTGSGEPLEVTVE